ncbi:TonB-dependent receptor [Urechidicola sp. KH5]
MKKLTFLYVTICMLFTSVAIGQTLTGTILDETNQPLPGADVLVVGTTDGAATDFNGAFSIDVASGSGAVQVSFIGYKSVTLDYTVASGETVDLGQIVLEVSNESLDEIVVVGVADIVKDRQTPIAVSTVRADEIQAKLGSQELPEILNATPSVYATKSGGGFGDSRINVRGFDQRNTAVMINGIPVNDMENGWVYWSNWAGLSDVTQAIQIQRGLGSSKLAVSSVGGTINVVTKTANAREGGVFSTSMGNDGYLKVLGSYSTGKLDNGLSVSLLLSQTQGNGYIDGTKFLANNYFLGIGYEINDNHSLQFIYTGAPQWHNQNSRAVEIYNYQRYGGSEDYPNRKYNAQWGYLDGEEYTWRRNFYHKPVMTVNWEWKLSDESSISTAAYASWGRGGGSGPIGRINGAQDWRPQFRDANGLIRFEDIRAWNMGESVPDFGADRSEPYINDRSNGFTRRASMNSHNWYGVIANYNTRFNENLSFNAGVDLRTYKGIHYRIVNSDLGADGYMDNRDINNPNRMITEYYGVTPNWNPFVNIKDQQKIEYYNDGNVGWAGAFSQLEYTSDKFSAFVQGAISQQTYERVDYFNYTPDEQTSEKESRTGGNIKAGLNYKINENHNVFVNSGYFSRQPFFDAVYLNFRNDLNPDLQNEKVFGLEAGYGLHNGRADVNVNFYRTSWQDRFESVSLTADDGTQGNANLYGIEQVHTGIELDARFRASDRLSLTGMFSVGNWEYKGDVTAQAFDDDQNPIGESVTLYLDGVKVGDAAQTTARLGADFQIMDGLTIDGSWRYANNLYAEIDATDFDDPDHQGSLELPSYDLVDFGATYRIPFNDDRQVLNFRLNVNNVFDEVYMAESDTNRHAEAGDDTYKGIRTDNRIYWGFGRTWNFTVRFEF